MKTPVQYAGEFIFFDAEAHGRLHTQDWHRERAVVSAYQVETLLERALADQMAAALDFNARRHMAALADEQELRRDRRRNAKKHHEGALRALRDEISRVLGDALVITGDPSIGVELATYGLRGKSPSLVVVDELGPSPGYDAGVPVLAQEGAANDAP